MLGRGEMRMKRILILIVLLCLLLTALSAGSPEYTLSFDWQMSVQFGIVSWFSDSLGIQGALGVSLMGLGSGELYILIDPAFLSDPWHLTMMAGIPNILAVPDLVGTMISFGGALELKRDLGEKFALSLRLGTGFPFFFEEGGALVRDIQFPLDLWPEASMTLTFR